MAMNADEAEEAAFKSHEAPSWEDDPVARDAAVRWHLRGFQAGSKYANGTTLHDEGCEADWGQEGQESPCRCAERPRGDSAVSDLITWHAGQVKLLWPFRRSSSHIKAAMMHAATVRALQAAELRAQRELSDAQIDAMQEILYDDNREGDRDVIRRAWRATLHAAAKAGSEAR